ncbi:MULTISPECIES: anti-sigma factor [Pontibacillus]|uniref:Anti-sigma-W factor RsiW n=1 Tax=Pontibacillus chungwhensis TaxID=265426 RepID=A0ABY8V2I6_9BACI|nr:MULTISPECIES: anti-sigma factor [Pontibacillus]MCD5322412.1 anti-sigma factor [Pontibacillus sp. HN14]WIF99698.1 anti-sigma factor [Pontibacillus chungwhensis]
MPKQCDRLIDYISGELQGEEKRAFEAHLEECDECREEVEEMESLMEELPYASEPVEPPKEMKSRVLANVFEGEQIETDTNVAHKEEYKEENVASLTTHKQEKRVKKPWTTLLAAGLLLSLSGNVYSFLATEDGATSNVEESIDEVSKKVTLSGQQEALASASIIKQQDNMTLVVEAQQMGRLQGDEVYQVWLINGETPYRAGSFVTNQNGEGAVAFSLSRLEAQGDFDTIAITKEPDATSKTPQGDIIVSSEL